MSADTDPGRAVERAKTRLDSLQLYPHPVRTDHVRIAVVPRLFRLPYLRRFEGYALPGVILLRKPVGHDPPTDDLITHELCHVWQMQHHPLSMPLSYLYRGYINNPYEIEARRAAAATRNAPASRPGA